MNLILLESEPLLPAKHYDYSFFFQKKKTLCDVASSSNTVTKIDASFCSRTIVDPPFFWILENSV